MALERPVCARNSCISCLLLDNEAKMSDILSCTMMTHFNKILIRTPTSPGRIVSGAAWRINLVSDRTFCRRRNRGRKISQSRVTF